MESRKNFLRRVKAETGQEFESLTLGTIEDVLGGTIVCRRQWVWVVGLGYPTESDAGLEFDEYVVVDQANGLDFSREIEAMRDPEDLLWVVKAARVRGFETLAQAALKKAMDIAEKEDSKE